MPFKVDHNIISNGVNGIFFCLLSNRRYRLLCKFSPRFFSSRARGQGGERGANASGPVHDIRPTPQPPSGFGMCQKYRIRIFYYDDDSACRERLLGGRASAVFPVRNSQRESSPLEYSSARTMNETEEKYVALLRNAAAAGARNGSWRYGAAVSPVANCAASVRNGRKTSTPTKFKAYGTGVFREIWRSIEFQKLNYILIGF